MSGSTRNLFIASCLGMTVVGISFISLGTILPMLIEGYDLSGSESGLLASMLPAGIIIGSLGFGPLADAFSYRFLLSISTLFTIAGLMLIWLLESYLVVLGSFLIIGAGSGALNGATNALVADINSHDPRKRSANLSLLAVFFGVGALIMPVYLAYSNPYLTYREAMFLISLIFIPLLIWFFVLKYPDPKQTGGPDLRVYGKLLKDPLMVLLCMILFFQSGMEGIINNWTTSMLEIGQGYEASSALTYLSIFVLTFTFSRFLISRLMKHTSARTVLRASYGVLILAAVSLLLSGSSPEMLIAFLVIMGIGSAAGFPLVLSYIGELYSRNSGTAYSMAFFIALVGNMIMNYSMGELSGRFGLEVYRYFVTVEVIALGLVLFPALKSLSVRITTDIGHDHRSGNISPH